MKYTLRDVQPDELEWLYELNKASYHEVVVRQFGEWNEAFQRDMFHSKWRSKPPGRIIEMEGERIGVVILEKRKEYDWLQEIQIVAHCRGHGLRSKLIRRFLEEARLDGRPLRLQVLHENLRAKKLYTRIGFRDIETLPNHYLMECASSK